MQAPSTLVHVVTILISIREALFSNLDWDTDYPAMSHPHFLQLILVHVEVPRRKLTTTSSS